MKVTLTKNGRLEIILTPTDAIDQAYLDEFKAASGKNNSPKIAMGASKDELQNLTLTVYLERQIGIGMKGEILE